MQKFIKNYHEYIPSGPRERDWGLHVTALGRTTIRPGQAYPPSRHPDQHHFSWATGRVLSTFQMVFISAGSGEIEWKSVRTKLKANECFFVMPAVWHRYRPDQHQGWTEHWIELRGRTMDEWLANGTIDPERLHFKLAADSRIKEFFEIIHSLATEKPPGYGMVMAGTAFALLGEGLRHASALGLEKNRKGISRLVRKAQHSLRRLDEGDPSMSDLARRLGVSYPTLLRHFRNETGLKPKEFYDQVRMARAERLLASEDLEIKEIASMLAFHSQFHFSTQFKKSYGCSPSAWRRRFSAESPASS